MPAPVRVLLVDDHEVFVDALALCLGDYPDIVVQGAATGVAQGLRRLQEVECDVVVLDLALAGEDGLTLAREALAQDPTLGIVIATGAEAGDQIVEAVQLGVRGWVAKTETADGPGRRDPGRGPRRDPHPGRPARRGAGVALARPAHHRRARPGHP